MKEERTYYEILDVLPNASFSDIRKAFREIQSLYDKESLSTYSLFSAKERDEILRKAQQAFEALVDREKRLAYDKTLMNAGKLSEDMVFSETRRTPAPIFKTSSPEITGQVSKNIKQKIQDPDFIRLKKAVLAKPDISGKDLKVLRRAANVSLLEIYEMSRVSVAVLESIESDQLEKLPPPTYLKAFLKAYAECLGLDVQPVVQGYMANIAL